MEGGRRAGCWGTWALCFRGFPLGHNRDNQTDPGANHEQASKQASERLSTAKASFASAGVPTCLSARLRQQRATKLAIVGKLANWDNWK